MTRIRVDMNLCQSNGQYEIVAPEISELGGEDILRWKEDILRWKEEVDPSLRQKAIKAIEVCPMQAIRAED
jgi:ferredoxin